MSLHENEIWRKSSANVSTTRWNQQRMLLEKCRNRLLRAQRKLAKIKVQTVNVYIGGCVGGKP